MGQCWFLSLKYFYCPVCFPHYPVSSFFNPTETQIHKTEESKLQIFIRSFSENGSSVYLFVSYSMFLDHTKVYDVEGLGVSDGMKMLTWVFVVSFYAQSAGLLFYGEENLL